MSLVLLLGAALAADPWGRPEHLRVVSAPPPTWAERGHTARPVRVFWDDDGRPAAVAVYSRGAWRVLADAARPGFETPPLPDGTRVRVRPAGAARWSPALHAPTLTTPAGLAELAAPGPALLGDVVGEVSPLPDGGGAWVSTLGGGAAWLDARLQPHPLTTWQGLPDDRVVAVHGEPGRALLGTPAGAALVEDGRVVRVVDAALPDPHVQAVRLDGPRLWLGTFRGLARVEGPTVETVLAPWSVFSITPAAQGGHWVGYEGVRHVAADAPPADPEVERPGDGWLVDDRVFGVLDTGRGVLAAGREAGVRLLGPQGTDGAVPGLPTAGAFDVGLGPGGPWVAAGALGLVGPDGQVWGRAAGLAGDTVYSVAGDGAGALWVGTDRGVARVWPTDTGDPEAPPRFAEVVARSPLPAGRPARDLLIGEAGAWVAGPDGVRQLGRPHPHGGDLVVAAGGRVAALVGTPGGVWAVGRRAVRLDPQGRLHHVEVPAPVVDAAWAGGALWAGGPDGLLRYSPTQDRFLTADGMPEVTRVAPDPEGPWVISRGAVFHVADGLVRPYLRTATALDLAPQPDTLWVGTADGVERLHRTGPDAGEGEVVVSGAAVPAVASDGAGGCWFAAEDGTVGRIDAAGRATRLTLPGPDPARPTRIVADGDAAFVLTEAGTWHVRLPPPGER
jgi:hypothetical protein